MTLREQLTLPVRTLALHCSSLLECFAAGDDQQGDAVHRFEAVVQAVESLTPRLELTQPGIVLLATRGPARYWGGEDELVRRVHAVAHQALADAAPAPAGSLAVASVIRVGLADGVFAAQLAAHAAPPNGSVVVPAGATAAFLAALPLEVLDRPGLTDVLRRLGLRALGDLATLPARDVLGRFGSEGRAAQLLASGLESRPPTPRPIPPELVVATEVDPPAESVEPVAFLARQLATELEDRLAARGLACTRLGIEVETEHGEQQVRLWRHEGALRAPMIADRVRWQVDGWLLGPAAQRPTAGVSLLRLVPDQVVPATGRQLGFWGGASREGERAARALARVQGMLGADAVCLPEWRGGRQPIEQIALVPLGTVDPSRAPPSVHTQRVAAPWPGRLPTPSPTVLHDPPLACEVCDVDGAAVGVGGRGALSGLPHRLLVGGRPHVIAQWAGPWLVDERWWDSSRHRRQARFQVVTTAGAAHLVVLEDRQWWLVATYD